MRSKERSMKSNTSTSNDSLKKIKEIPMMKLYRLLISLVLFAALPLAGCVSRARVGELQTETQTVELGDAETVHTEIDFGAGHLKVSGGAEEQMKAEFNYNVAKLKPEVEYIDGTLIVKQPETKGLPALLGITDYRNEWSLRFNKDVPMDLSVNLGAGTGDLQLAGLWLTRLDISLGASDSTVDLSGDWAENLDVTIDSGATDITVLLPKDVGVRVVVETGPVMVEAQGLSKDGNVYTNAAYGVSDVTLKVNVKAGIGTVYLDVE
jgi:hypothetical protein